jgi:hypothetical protein
MAYRDDIRALTPDHYWTFSNTFNDSGFATPLRPADLSVSAVIYEEIPIAEGATYSRKLTGTSSRFECADNAEMNAGVHPEKCMGGWIRLGRMNETITCIYKQGGGTNNITFFLFPGNSIMCQALATSATPDINVQVFGDTPLELFRSYHICYRFGGPLNGNAFEFYLDGVKQTNFIGDAPDTDFPSHTSDITWGDSDLDLRIGINTLTTASLPNTRYSHWATWTRQLDPDTEIREVLFEKGALPTHTVTNQTELDALADTTLGNHSLSIRVDVSGDIDLDALNIVFDSKTSIHVQYTGTGTLNWTNSGGSNASIASTTNGGTINFINPANITLTGIKNNSEVRVYEAGTQNEIVGQENITTGTYTFSSTQATVDLVVISLQYQNLRIQNLDTAVDSTIPIQQIIDRQYLNP